VPGAKQDAPAAGVEIRARACGPAHDRAPSKPRRDRTSKSALVRWGPLMGILRWRSGGRVASRARTGYIATMPVLTNRPASSPLSQSAPDADATPLRPSLLDRLFAPATALPGVGPKVAPLLDRLVAEPGRPARVLDLLFHLPQGGIARELKGSIADAPVGEPVRCRHRRRSSRPARGPRQGALQGCWSRTTRAT
jgi:hypothetical protein